MSKNPPKPLARDSASRTRASFTLDARGRRVRLYDPMADWLLARHDRIDRETLERIMGELDAKTHGGRRFILGGIIFLILLTLAAGVGITASVIEEGGSALHDLRQALWLTGPGVGVMLIAGVAWPLLSARRKRRLRLRAVMLAHKRCAHCGYDLHAVPQNQSGVTCPECSCAWVLSGTQES